MAVKVFLGLVIVGWLFKLAWERGFKRRTGRPAAELWANPANPGLIRPAPQNKVFPAAPPSTYQGLPPLSDKHFWGTIEKEIEREKQKADLLRAAPNN